jgi:hypothetical protein
VADDAEYRAGGVLAVLSHEETCELRLLFSQTAHLCNVAFETLGKAGEPPAGSEFQRFKELTGRLNEFVARINSMVG